MFVSVKERARQIANGQFTAPTTSAPATSLIDIAPEPKSSNTATPRKTGATEKCSKIGGSPPTTKSSRASPSKEPTPKPASEKVVASTTIVPKSPSLKPPPTKAAHPAKKSSSKSSTSKEPIQKPSSPKIGSSKSTSSKKAMAHPKSPSTANVTSSTKATPTTKSAASKAPSAPTLKSKRSKSPPKRVDSPMEDEEDPLSALKAACLKQVTGVTGLGGRRLAIVLRQRSSGGWYAALKDTGSDKYLKMWMNKEKTSATKEEALETYLVFATKMRNEVRWFPMSPRASSPKAKGK
ncbi:hypothetical protein E8E13_008917 [Curvularia kusanoi]|uniref:Uncharacterized protein n=1 Tax=Curvularia kusanoi TaxID=90978 RepID=A0A9P4TBY9_CURKU|nr:hypothetical protein E8E13_008917 [Curvularia kusanoi]